MLVCNVSLRPPRPAIAAAITEIIAAVDATATGNVIFATLVDAPASANEILDAYLGEIMIETASAVDDVTAGSIYVAAIDESTTAVDMQDATLGAVGVARQAMIDAVFVDSSTTSREANVGGTQVNL